MSFDPERYAAETSDFDVYVVNLAKLPAHTLKWILEWGIRLA